MGRALVMYARGRLPDAMTDAQTAIDGIDRGWRLAVPLPHAVLAWSLIDRGELEQAAAVLADKRATQRGPADGLAAWSLSARGTLRLARGDAEGALEDQLAAGRGLTPFGIVNPAALPWRSLAGMAAHAAGDADRAQALIDEEVGLARDFGARRALGAALRARAVLEDPATSLVTLAEAIAVLSDADAPLELARALLDLGGVHRRAGRRVVSREPLRRALELAHQCGATALEQRAHEELQASGARPRRPALSGVDALTPSERRIADLVTEGRSNRQIAESLFLTKNTVAWHLRHIYRKLGVSTRDELRAQVAAEPNGGGNGSFTPM
jgi:DNA-binding CsgD family transcriptional regulator